MKTRTVCDEVGNMAFAREEQPADEHDQGEGLYGSGDELQVVAAFCAAVVDDDEDGEETGGDGFYADVLEGIDVGDEGDMQFDRGFHGGVEAGQVYKEAEVLRGDEGHGGDGGGVDDDIGGPAKKEGNEIAIDLLQVHVGAARVGEHGSEFGIDHRADDRDEAGDDPDEEEHVGRAEAFGHGGGAHEDARTDDAADDQRDGGTQTQGFF